MPGDAVEAILQDLESRGELPSLPQIVVKLNAAADNPHSSAADLANIILRDQALTSHVLRIANSVFYGGGSHRRVATVTQAVVVLGFQAVVQLAMGISVFGALNQGMTSDHLLRIWIHSVACAVATQALARRARLTNLEEAFVAGLIHDVGKLVLLRCSPDDYESIAARVESGEPQIDAERAVVGCTHAEIGRALATKWNMPSALVGVIGDHHSFGEPSERFRNIVTLGNEIAMLHYSSHSGQASISIRDLERMAEVHCSLPPDALGITLDTLRDGVEECLTIFGLDQACGASRIGGVTSEGEQSRTRLHEVFTHMQGEIERKSAQIAMLQEITASMVQNSDPKQMVPMILEGVFLSLGLERIVLALRSEGGIGPAVGFGADLEEAMDLVTVPESRIDHPILEVMRSGQAINVFDSAMPIHSEALRSWGWPSRALVIVPVMGTAEMIGAVVADRGGAALSNEDSEAIGLFANALSLVLSKGKTD